MKKKYTLFEKSLHHVILNNKFLNKSLFEVEKKFFLNNKNNIINNKHLFISGLPRSGTTILLNFFFSSGEFESLKYRDMPFLLSPNLFSKFDRRNNIESFLRSHNDRIKINLDSPEAFDEVFIRLYEMDDDFEQNFVDYITLVLIKYNGKRYLSKNNHNYKRINKILKFLPNSIFVIPFRSPLKHSLSLLNQHQNFLSKQKDNKFIISYMNYLGHNEFGLNHVSWNNPIKYSDFNNLNYWMEQWFLFYSSILKKFVGNDRVILFSYDDLCNDSDKIKLLSKKIDLLVQPDNFKFSDSNLMINENYDKELLQKSLEIEIKLKSFSI